VNAESTGIFKVLTQPIPEETTENSVYPKTSRPIRDRVWNRECASKPDAFSLSSCLLLRNAANTNGQTENEKTKHGMQFAHTNYKINNMHSCGKTFDRVQCFFFLILWFNKTRMVGQQHYETHIVHSTKKWLNYLLVCTTGALSAFSVSL